MKPNFQDHNRTSNILKIENEKNLKRKVEVLKIKNWKLKMRNKILKILWKVVRFIIMEFP